MKYLSVVDSAFLRMESRRTPMHIGVLLIFKQLENAPRDQLNRLIELYRDTPVKLFPFNSKLKKGVYFKLRPAWEKDNKIDLDYHVRHLALPAPGGERELGILVERLHSNALDFSRPLWEFHLIEGLANNRFAVYMKTHHSVTDGVGGMQLLKNWLSADINPGNLPPWAIQPKRKAVHKNSAQEPLRSPGTSDDKEHSKGGRIAMLRGHWNATAQLSKALLQMADKNENPDGGIYSVLDTPQSFFNQAVTQQRRLATQLFSATRIRSVADKSNCTMNDVFLTLVGTAVRRYLLEINELPCNSLIASVPLALSRPRNQFGNSVAGFICPLKTELSDPVVRLQKISSITKRSIYQLRSLPRDALKQFSVATLLPIVASQISGLGAKMPCLFNLAISSVNAGKSKSYLEGAELEAIYPVSVLFDGNALNVSIVSYADTVAFSFTGCREAIPSLQRIAVYAGDALNYLEGRVQEIA